MDLLLLGVNHRTASLPEREALALDPDATARLLADLVGRGDNRRGARPVHLQPHGVLRWWPTTSRRRRACARQRGRAIKGARLAEPGASLYQHSGTSASQHLFRVASGLDSMVVGETQILGQVKDAFALARDAGATGPMLDRLVESALRAGKRARTETGIGTGVVSVASAACELARRSSPRWTTAAWSSSAPVKLAPRRAAPGTLLPGAVTIVNRSRDRGGRSPPKSAAAQ